MGFFDKLKAGLAKTKQSILGQINDIFKHFVKVDEEMLEELEEILIAADVGYAATEEILEKLRGKIKEERIEEPQAARAALMEILVDMIGEGEELKIETKPAVILVIGVNGVGKTTSVAKIASCLKSDGKKVLLCAADTFRAGAIEQLQIWGDRAGIEVIKHSEGSDPAAVVFDAANAAKAKDADVLIVDTAGRLHNKKNLMNELAKIDRVLERELPGSAKETLLVLDAVTGQNAVNQAIEFKNASDITGIVLTKLDGTAKGGIAFSIKKVLGIPVKYIGVGEKLDDLQEFDAREFVRALFEE